MKEEETLEDAVLYFALQGRSIAREINAIGEPSSEDELVRLALRRRLMAREIRDVENSSSERNNECIDEDHPNRLLSCDWGIPPARAVYAGVSPAEYHALDSLRLFMAARPYMKHESLTAGQNLYLNILKQTEERQKAEDAKSPLANFTNPYIHKGMLTPNPDWEEKVKSGEIDRLYGINSAELVKTLPKLLDDCSLVWTRPFYCIDHFCLKVAIALRLKVLKRQDLVNKEFSHASIRRDAWADDHWQACDECEDCENCRYKADCADIFWG